MSFFTLIKWAWRDTRRNRTRLLLFISSIITGIAALVAINSFSENLQHDINNQAKTLLGADFVVSGTQAAPQKVKQILDTLPGEKAQMQNFISMALFPNGGTRLAQIKVLEGKYPFYGKVNTVPAAAYQELTKGQNALLDRTLMIQYNLKIGDTIHIGDLPFLVIGQINGVTGRAGLSASIAPAIYIPMQFAAATGLLQKGSRVEYQYYFKMDEKANPDAIGKSIEKTLEESNFDYETVESRKKSLGEAFSNFADFLNLVGFISLLLGCIGVASAVNVYIKEKINTIAILRCLGASGRQAFIVYLIQITSMGFIGALAGAALGTILQKVLPIVLKDFLPLESISSNVSMSAIAQGVFAGVCIAILFALLPLVAIRRVSPLRTLRAAYEEDTEVSKSFDWLRWLVIIGIAVFIGSFTWFQTKSLNVTIGFIGGVAVVFLVLTTIAWLLMRALKQFFPTSLSYVFRQGIANLFRPNNQTLTLIVSIGLGTFLIATLLSIQHLLLKQLAFSGSGNQPNMILFDIQSSQRDSVAALVDASGMKAIQQVPVITMHLEDINGINRMEYLQDSTSDVPRWVYDREYRVTYRDTLIESEKIVKGNFIGNKNGDTIYVSVSDRIAGDMHVDIGSHLLFNVQGVMIPTVVSSIRKVDFNRVQTNFLILFPRGVLEQAPQFHVVVTRVDSPQQSAKFQQDLVKRFPNVSAIELTQILKSVDEVLSKVSFVIRFMALFSIITGLLVLINAVSLSKYQRIRESVLLRTLGAQRKQILQINGIEYFLLAILASFTGILLSVGATWALAYFVFQAPFTLDWLSLLILLISIIFIMLFIGIFNSRQVVQKSPLEVLRAEVS